MVEIEVKIKINAVSPIKEKIINSGAKLEKDRYYEENTLFDFPNHSLLKKSEALRLRTINKKYYLTYKGAPQRSRKFKIRKEYETEIKNGKQFKKILKSLNLVPVFQYNKHRTVYKSKNLKIFLDELSIGNFLELEGNQSDIVRFAKSLNLSKKDFIKTDYIQLLKKNST
ncbi:MAG: class IV adenylate cyclase [Candidatus Aminicenantaceae bacterium]